MSIGNEASKAPKTAKALLYLDAERMYSLSSQLFEGFAESRILQSGEEQFETERQRGPIASGRELADEKGTSRLTQERRFLHDWGYTEFERRLISEGAVQVINAGSTEAPSTAGGFVKVSGVGGVRDMDALIAFVEDYNEIGLSLTYISSFKQLEEAQAQVETAVAEEKDRNKRASIRARANAALDLKTLAKSQNLQFDEKFLKELVAVVRRWFSGHIEAALRAADLGVEYVAAMNPAYLRQPKELLARKYGRKPNIPLTIFGTRIPTAEPATTPENGAASTARAGLQTMMGVLAEVDERVAGASPHEEMIDPIAVYIDVPYPQP